MTTLVTNGHTYTDDDNPNTGMGNGGFRLRLLPMLSDVMVDLATGITASNTAVAAKNSAEAAAAAAAASAGVAAGTQLTCTSTTSITPSIGDKVFTVPAGRQFVTNVPIYIVSQGLVDVWMQCTLKSYVGTQLTVTVVSFGTATARTDWNISVSGAIGKGLIASNTAFTAVAMGAATALDLSNGNAYFKKTVAGTVNFTFTGVPAGGSSITLELQYDSGSFGFPASVLPPGGTFPTLVTGKTYLIVLVTSNGGTSWKFSVGNPYANG